jgi:sigma-B regulation protein RsbU (phosphoserine phosphatase)
VPIKQWVLAGRLQHRKRQLGFDLQLHSILETTRDTAIIFNERDEAREIQLSLLPAGNLEHPACEVAHRFSPFSEVGGDFADFFQLSNGHIGIYVGDVVGKGLAAAMYGALVMGILRGIHKTGESTAATLALLNDRLLQRPVAGRYAATLYAAFDPNSLILNFANAGLPYPLLASASGCGPIGCGGLPSGLLPKSRYEANTVQLSPGDAVLFATDGLHDLRAENGDDFSWDRMREIWQQCHRKSAKESLDLLFEEAARFSGEGRQEDDITAVVLKVAEH